MSTHFSLYLSTSLMYTTHMDNNRKNKKTPDDDAIGEIITWVVTFILLFAFWPVGIFMLFKKLRGNAKGYETANRKTADPLVPAAAKPTAKKQKKSERSPLEKKSGKFLSTVLLLISIALFIIGANTIVGAVQDGWANGLTSKPEFFLGVFYFIGGFISLFSRNISVRRLSRYKKYYAFVGGRGIVSIPEIALSAGHSISAVKRDLQAMINAGHFGPHAYIDSELNSLVLFPEAAKEARDAKTPDREQPKPAEKPENQYMAIIIELRDLNATIADIAISDKIDRIEELTSKIFRIVEENPAKLPQIRRFMNYYLPTTLKLLNSYALLEKQGIKGENITASKENIGRILDTLAKGYEQQLDQLFESDAIDIAADINVLENLMQQDGLTGDKPELKTMQGTM